MATASEKTAVPAVHALSESSHPNGPMRVILSVVACVAWMAASSILILINKYIMVDLKFKYPITVSGLSMLSSGILSFICCRVLKLVPAETEVSFEFWMSKMLPVGLFMAITLWTGNEVYLYLTVAFIQILKAFTPIITMMALFIARLEDPSIKMILSVLLVATGTAIAAYGEVNLSFVGIFFMFSAETSESIRLVMTQYLLVGLRFHPIEGLMYLSPACCIWLVIGAALREMPAIAKTNGLAILYDHPVICLLAAVMGFAVNTLTYVAIMLASSLTLKVLGTVRNTLLVIVGIVFLGEEVTGIQGAGYLISLVGFTWYNKIKMTEIANGAVSGEGASGGQK